MAEQAPSEDPAILEQLHEHELVLERRLDEARQAARARERETAAQVALLEAEARQALAQELARMRTEHARELESLTRRAREQTDHECRDLRQHFVERRESAATHALALLAATEG